ncbi:MAG: aldose epimerase family protein [Cyclobacteriaceae bacterium]
MKSTVFGKLPDGKDVRIFTLQNGDVTVKILNYGAVIQSLLAPDSQGNLADIILGYDTFDPYISNPTFMGAVAGRYANRIASATFELDGKRYNLARNNGPNSLHGGVNKPLHQVWWEPWTIDDHTLELTHKSAAMDDGFPGNVIFKITYSLSKKNELSIHYQAETNEPTVINLTNHSYFNLSGKNQSIYDHELIIHSPEILKLNDHQIPINFMPVAGTPFDFRRPKPVGRDINADNEQLKIGNGYDVNWVVNPEMTQKKHVASLSHPSTGRKLDVYTSEPGIQVYTANYLDHTGKGGLHYQKHYGICLETQHYPDSPNRPEFPSTVLRPGEIFRSETIFQCGIV